MSFHQKLTVLKSAPIKHSSSSDEAKKPPSPRPTLCSVRPLRMPLSSSNSDDEHCNFIRRKMIYSSSPPIPVLVSKSKNPDQMYLDQLHWVEKPWFLNQLTPNHKIGIYPDELIYKVTDPNQVSFAIKVIPKTAIFDNPFLIHQLATQIQLQFGFKNEARSHNICPILSASQDDNNLYICMQWANRGDLCTFLSKLSNHLKKIKNPVEHQNKKLNFASHLIKYWGQIKDTIAFLHQNNIAHLDIKPENVLRDLHNKKTRLLLSDFKFSQNLKYTPVGSSIYIGTDVWLPPEILAIRLGDLPSNSFYDPKAVDYYMLGLLLYRMVMQRYFYNLPIQNEDPHVSTYEQQKKFESLRQSLLQKQIQLFKIGEINQFQHTPQFNDIIFQKSPTLIKIICELLNWNPEKRSEYFNLQLNEDLSRLEKELSSSMPRLSPRFFPSQHIPTAELNKELL